MSEWGPGDHLAVWALGCVALFVGVGVVWGVVQLLSQPHVAKTLALGALIIAVPWVVGYTVFDTLG